MRGYGGIVALVLGTACYSPTVRPGAPCSLDLGAWQWLENDGDTWGAFVCNGMPYDTQMFLRAIHATTPIRAVILDGFLEEAEDDWTGWSRQIADWPEVPTIEDNEDPAFEDVVRSRDEL